MLPHSLDCGLAPDRLLDSRLNVLVERAAKESGAHHASLLIRKQGTSELCNVACYGSKETPNGDDAIARYVLSKAGSLCLQDDTDIKAIAGLRLDKDALPIICAPVVSDGVSWGVLIVGYPCVAGVEFCDKLTLLEGMAALAGAFLENAALQAGLRQKEEQVCNLIRDTLQAQETEREHVCLEVHDGVGQTLASAFQYLQTMETAAPDDSSTRQLLIKARALVKQAIQESREVINSLQPATLRDLGLVATLRQELQQLKRETGWQVEFKADATRLPTYVETGLYRIIHEAITNAKKHARTNRLCVTITSSIDRLNIVIKDWGIGFSGNPEDMLRMGGTGMLSMRKRAELLQGTFNVEAKLGHGTTVWVEIPLPKLAVR